MKSSKEIRTAGSNRETDEAIRKAVKLPPIKKNGKDKHAFYNSLEEDDDETLTVYKKRESVLDYFDDVDEDGEIDDEEIDDYEFVGDEEEDGYEDA